jgi:hypothetical protein
MDSTLPSQDELDPLDMDYAAFIVDGAPKLERVQKLLPMIPPGLLALFQKQSNDFLFGAATIAQASHHLAGIEALISAAEVIDKHPDNKEARAMANVAVQLVGVLEALGYLACKELVSRSTSNGK